MKIKEKKTILNKKNIAILGSTGSIGTQALEVVRAFPDRFEVSVLTGGRNVDLLIEQALIHTPKYVVNTSGIGMKRMQSSLAHLPIQILSGEEALVEVVQDPSIELVLNAVVGSAGLRPTCQAIVSGKDIALANKETLVVAGELVMGLAKKHNVRILPVDSEHSAIFQCLVGEAQNPIEKIYLTASGGPFRGRDRTFLEQVTKEQALKHPNWAMGAKITIDSASLMNKGLEVIEAKWLFDLEPGQIDVVVHPQSIIHSLVQFQDGSIKAQLGLPDMKLPIQYALTYPDRYANGFERFDFARYASLDFQTPDMETFRNLKLAYQALEEGGNRPCVLNAANEAVVEAFLQDKISFLGMSDVIEETLCQIAYQKMAGMEEYIACDEASRRVARDLIDSR